MFTVGAEGCTCIRYKFRGLKVCVCVGGGGVLFLDPQLIPQTGATGNSVARKFRDCELYFMVHC